MLDWKGLVLPEDYVSTTTFPWQGPGQWRWCWLDATGAHPSLWEQNVPTEKQLQLPSTKYHNKGQQIRLPITFWDTNFWAQFLVFACSKTINSQISAADVSNLHTICRWFSKHQLWPGNNFGDLLKLLGTIAKSLSLQWHQPFSKLFLLFLYSHYRFNLYLKVKVIHFSFCHQISNPWRFERCLAS